MFKKTQNDRVNNYIREKIKEARTEADESQEELANILEKSRVAVSDLERGRVSVSAADLGFIAAHYEKPISFFFPPRVSYSKDELTPLDEELLFLFGQLPITQKHIALEYVKQQVDISKRAHDRELREKYINVQSKSTKV